MSHVSREDGLLDFPAARLTEYRLPTDGRTYGRLNRLEAQRRKAEVWLMLSVAFAVVLVLGLVAAIWWQF